ncbi:MAG: hypothetical protein JNM56_30935 [Planctomycetia bacterium]|nr:hypothetical protein [Planctomycetia bacterium]
MWHRIAIDPNKDYVLQLCQNAERVRYFRARAIDEAPHADMVFETVPLPAEIVRDYRLEELRGRHLSNGEMFAFGPHGEWFTEAESNVMRRRGGWNNIPWHNGIAPRLPPK